MFSNSRAGDPGRRLQPRWPSRLAAMAGRRRPPGRLSRRLRRIIALLLLIAAGGLAMVRDPLPHSGTEVVTAARDLPAGRVIDHDDVAVLTVLDPPDGALRQPSIATGRLSSGPVRRGEILTDARLIPNTGPDPGPGRVAVPVRPSDPTTVDLLAVGMHVAILAAAADGSPSMIAADAVVLTVHAGSGDSSGRLIVVSVPAAAADRLAAAGLDRDLAVRFT